MAQSTRIILRGVQGRVRHNHNFAAIHQNSAVIITACQFRFSGGIAGIAGRPFLGDADVYVTNVGPHDPEGGDGGVEFHIHADSPTPIDVMVTITALDDVESTTLF
ncbi:hypothetical protein FHT40_006330 [Mycolicibacterium sp. BK556]|uniref:hypothetical protein n=1 Tax=Mycobacteriaceae TaxID=1762 RepID=UPI000D3CE826|nr:MULTISPECIES: hypothetical protein [Mycobacteriaceae]MBB3606639.1 hypothetical protein [Mycolicibacterium sp. BK556]MBB3636114.1 hypothetical protein [Mycolicibacterium sp. BK607]MBB3753742.1 hypothetical protein [Mycolicibacterium sp. BK634]TDO06589.1 hypothetical protein EV580_6689 [Mycobacterium sp. BK086]